jgi:phosphoribosylformylglycinamidine (FGAM) synthase-like enzyme
VTLAESCISGRTGANLSLPAGIRPDALLFGEAPSRIVVTVGARDLQALVAMAGEMGVPLTVLGTTGGTLLNIDVSGNSLVHVPVAGLAAAWSGSLPQAMSV